MRFLLEIRCVGGRRETADGCICSPARVAWPPTGTNSPDYPTFNPQKSVEYWLSQPGAPKAKLANEKPKGQTVDYDKLLQA